ncbi:MAG: DUF2339 domain-containing protein, partial [Paracoccaceae bacterium]
MDEILVLLALVAVAIPLAILVLFVSQSRLKTRATRLERALSELQAQINTLRLAPGDVAPTAAIAPPETKPETQPAPIATAMDADSPWMRAMPAGAEPAKPDTVIRVPAAPSEDQNRPLVINADRANALMTWLTTNWVYAVSALSLALAGVFFVQYGMEKGLLPPAVRVILSILFGMALIAAGEWLRRRDGGMGDATSAATAYLPSVFSGAGLVSIFAGILAARQMYDLIGYQTAFAGLLATAVLAVVLGWFYGPLLAAVGLLGASVAPFVVGGPGDAAPWLYGHFTLIAVVGLAVDAVRRWAWVSVLALVLAFGGGFLVFASGAGTGGWTLMLVALAVLATCLPILRLTPDHDGPTVLGALLRRDGVWPNFPVRLAAGAALVSSVGVLMLDRATPLESLLGYAALAGLALFWLLGAARAKGLADLALLPSAAFVLRLVGDAAGHWPLYTDFAAQAIALRAPDASAPYTVTLLLALATAITLAAMLRALVARGGAFPLVFGLMAVLV